MFRSSFCLHILGGQFQEHVLQTHSSGLKLHDGAVGSCQQPEHLGPGIGLFIRLQMDGGMWVNFDWDSYRKNVRHLRVVK